MSNYRGADMKALGDWAMTAEARLRDVCKRQRDEMEALTALVAQLKRDNTRLRRQVKLASAGRVVNIDSKRQKVAVK